MDQEKEISAVVRVEGKTADKGLLHIYDAAHFLNGLARAFNIVTHAFANDNEIRTQASLAHGSQTFVHSSKKGCFEEQIDVIFAADTAKRLGKSVLANNFWDYLQFAWASSVGVESKPESARTIALAEGDGEGEGVFGVEIGDALESAMVEIHKPIVRDKTAKIFLNRPRIGDLLQFDAGTLDYVTTSHIEEEFVTITANVTRYNILTDFGRLYEDGQREIVPFKLENPNDRMRQLAVASMQERLRAQPGKLRLKVKRLIGAHGKVKRYFVHGITQRGDE